MTRRRAPPGGVEGGGTCTEEAECGEGERLTDGSVEAMKRGNARGAKGPCYEVKRVDTDFFSEE
jgi:hypothetical protein